MAQPLSTVRFVSKRKERKGCGAKLGSDSQTGKMMAQTQPITSMAIMLALCQPLLTVAANVRGINMREMAADSNSRPMMSNSYQRFRTPPTMEVDFDGELGRRLSRAALRTFNKRESASGKNAAGSTMVQMP